MQCKAGPDKGAVTLTIDGEMHPAAVMESVVLLVQHEHLALVPALVLGADLFNVQRRLVMKVGTAWRRQARPGQQTVTGNRHLSSSSGPHAIRATQEIQSDSHLEALAARDGRQDTDIQREARSICMLERLQ